MKKIKSILFPSIIFLLTAFAIIFATQYGATPESVDAQSDTSTNTPPTTRLTGYAWSENIGWISFKDGSVPVKVKDDGTLVGYAWSENIGWIQFGGLSGFPNSSYGGNAKLEGNTVTGWARAVAGMNSTEYNMASKALSSEIASASSGSGSSGQWIAYAPAGYENYGIYLSKLPATSHTVAGETFLVYDTIKISSKSLVEFKKDPVSAIQNATTLDVGANRGQRWIFNLAQLQAEPTATAKSEIINLKSSFHSRFACSTSQVNAPACHRNNTGGYFPAIGYTQGGAIYTAVRDSNGGASMSGSTIIGTYTVGTSGATTGTSISQSSAPLNSVDNRGGWDGWIALNGVKISTVLPTNPFSLGGCANGCAWGSDVIGWVDFDGVTTGIQKNSCTGTYGTVIPDGSNFTFYSPVAQDGTCTTQIKSCTNGVLSPNSPSYTELNCAQETAECTRGGKTYQDGDKVVFYAKAIAGRGQTCESLKAELECVNGEFKDSEGNVNELNKTLKCINNPSFQEQ